MTLDQLRIFLEVAARQHVTRTAEALNMTQSAVSAAIAALEARHAVVLFDRIGRNIVLTDAGTRFIPHARAILREAAEAEGFLADLRQMVSGRLRVEASQTVASYWLPSFLIRYRARYPDVALEFRQGNTATVVAAVVDGSADLGFVEGAVSAPELSVDGVADDSLAVLVGRMHPWADMGTLSPADLVTTDWVLREEGSGTRAAFDRELRMLGLDPGGLSTVMALPSNEACMAAVETGTAATVLSSRAAAPHLAQGLLVRAGISLTQRSFSAIRHRARHQSRAASALLALIAEDGLPAPSRRDPPRRKAPGTAP